MRNKAIGYKVSAALCYAFANGVNKYLVTIGCVNVFFWQTLLIVIFLIIYCICSKAKIADSYVHSKSNMIYQFIRGILLFCAVMLWYEAIMILPLHVILILSLIGPIFTMILSILCCNSRLYWYRFISMLLSFTGSIFLILDHITYNDNINFNNLIISCNYKILYPLLSCLFYSISDIFTKKIIKNNKSDILLLLSTNLIALLLYIICGFNMDIIAFNQFYFILILSIIAITAHYCHIRAIGLYDIIGLMPFGFVRRILGCAIGFFYFNESISKNILYGGIFMIISIIFVNFFERKYSSV